MATTYYRVSTRPLTEEDCHDEHISELWVGEDDETRAGMSCCKTYDDLINYFVGIPGQTSAGRGARMEGCYITVLEGTLSDDEGYDSHDGEVLVHPTRIVSNCPVQDEFMDDLAEGIKARWGSDMARYDAKQGWRALDYCPHCGGTGVDEEDGEECYHCGGSGEERWH